jgi:asparagine synthase (glutamine-hydrolysing)
MSGIVGLINLNGAAIDRGLLLRMTEYLAFRGPDGQRLQLAHNIGFGYAFLDLGDPSREQPFTLDGRHWIVGDVRVDARQDLIGELSEPGVATFGADVSDIELILRAYLRWGEDCVTHLLGDFMFAVWDAPRQRLFCARDHLGVKPFFYADLQGTVVISNTLDCIHLHPAATRCLNDSAIADFLLFGANQDSRSTSFRDIRRLPPAHSMTWSKHSVQCRRYWTLPIDEPIFFRRDEDYSERFTELLQTALRDRLRTDRVGVLMSGGVDSPTLAAMAVRLMRDRPNGFFLQAITSVYDRLVPDDERYYAGLVAEHLDIPIRYDVRDDETSIAQWDQVSIHTPEPVDNPPAFAASVVFLQRMSSEVRVFLYGEGPDNALQYEWRCYLAYLVANGRILPLVRALCDDLVMHRRIPLWGSVRHLVTARSLAREWTEVFPDWLNPEFSARCECRERWAARQRQLPSPHPLRPRGYAGFGSVDWQSLFEGCDINGALSHGEFRHPFLDLRLLRFMLAVPAMPWCRNKLIIRRSMRATLPDEVLRRRKTTMPVSPDFRRVQASGMPRLAASPDLLKYVNPSRISPPASPLELRMRLRPLGLNYWLSGLERNRQEGRSL